MKEYIRPVKNDIKDSSKGVIEIMKSQALRNSNISNGHLMLGVQEHLNISQSMEPRKEILWRSITKNAKQEMGAKKIILRQIGNDWFDTI